jgi:hypothetical protein
MTHDEYERRKRRLDEDLRVGIELLETAHRHQVRALQLVLVASGVEAMETLPAMRAVAPLLLSASALPVSPTQPADSPQPARRGPWALFNDVVDALAAVPEVFDRNDICRVLGYEPDRGSLYRTFQELKREGVLAQEQRGTGKWPARYRKTALTDAPAAE